MSNPSFVDIKPNPNIPKLAPGDSVRVHSRIVEGDKERIQVFHGVIIKIKSGGSANFTVRRISHGVGIERTFPIYSPLVEKVEVVRHGKVRRARLYYLRGLSAKKARIKERRVTPEELAPEAEPEAEVEAPEAEAEVPATEAEAPEAETAGEPPAAEATPTATEAETAEIEDTAEPPRTEAEAPEKEDQKESS